MKMGILGAGGIARTMANTVKQMRGVQVAAIGSRSQDKAEAFAREFNIPQAYGSYAALAQAEDLDLIYIATPHSRHFEDAMLCLKNGKNVLCEKAFTANAAQAQQLIVYAQQRHIFLSEAIWTRFLPVRATLDSLIASGVIGEISSLTANLGYAIEHIERLRKPELAGGALLDLGVYTINFALMAFGNEIAEIKSSCVKNAFGVDANNSIILNFKDGKTALLHSNMAANLDRRGIIYGNKGRIECDNINNCAEIRVILNNGEEKVYRAPAQISGYEHEVAAAMQAIAAGQIECAQMPHNETLRVMHIMDALREAWGIRYPFEG